MTKFNKDFKIVHIKKKKNNLKKECFLTKIGAPRPAASLTFGNLLERQIPGPHPKVLNQKL